MNDNYQNFHFGDDVQTFAYRLVYLHPSDYSDERIAVGLVSDGLKNLEAKFISSVASVELLSRIFGEEGTEQFQFAAAEFRRMLNGIQDIDSIEVSTDMLVLGDTILATTSDRSGLLTSALEAASCLIRAGSSRSREVFSSSSTMKFANELCDSVSKLNPMLATRIFRQKHKFPDGEIIDFPILGDRIFGAPISFAGRAIGLSDQKTRAEAMVAKFQVYRRHLNQRPKLYLLAPLHQMTSGQSSVDVHVNELRAVAEASSVELKISHSKDELAASVVSDEAA